MSLNNFEILQKIGNEEKSSLLKVKRKKDGLIYILKTVVFQSLDEDEKQSALNEIKIVASLSHPNINEFKEAFFDESTKTLNKIFEFPHNGNLSNKINYAIKNGMKMEECIIWNVLVQILNGVNYLHKKGIIHRNLKSKNILLNNQRLVKISDFEASCVVKNDNKMITGQIGTPFYTAPEIWEDEPYNYKCDIWSIGCIIYEMASLTLPFEGDTIASLYENIMSKEIKPIPDFYSEDLKKIIIDMIKFDPSKRPSTDLLLNYPRIKEESSKLKDIYEKYEINKNSRNIQNKDNPQMVKELPSESNPNHNLVYQKSYTNMQIPLNDKSQFTVPFENQNFNSKTSDLFKNKLKIIISNSNYKPLKERIKPNLVEQRKKGSRSHSKEKYNISNFNNLNNISTKRLLEPNINKIKEKVGLPSYSMNNADIKLFLSGNKLKNNLMFLKPNLENNGEIIVENKGENDYKPILTDYANTKKIQDIYIYPRRSPENKGKNNLIKSPKFMRNKLIKKMLNINLTDDNNIINNDNMTNKNNKEMTMKYNKNVNLNLEYMRKFNNRNISNENALIFKKLKDARKENITNDISNTNFDDKNFATYNSIKVNDSFFKVSNKLDNGNCGNQRELKMLSNYNQKPKESKAKYQNNNNIDINNVNFLLKTHY